MTTKQIDYCIELARTQSFSRGSENLFVSQPTFSYQIKLLEDEVGFAIFERNRVYYVMTVKMFCVEVRGDNTLKTIPPNLLHELHSNPLRKLRCQFHVLKTDISVISLNSVCLSELFLYVDKLISRTGWITVDSLNIKLSLRFLLILRVTEDIPKRLVLFFCEGFSGSLLFVGRIIDDVFEVRFDWP